MRIFSHFFTHSCLKKTLLRWSVNIPEKILATSVFFSLCFPELEGSEQHTLYIMRWFIRICVDQFIHQYTWDRLYICRRASDPWYQLYSLELVRSTDSCPSFLFSVPALLFAFEMNIFTTSNRKTKLNGEILKEKKELNCTFCNTSLLLAQHFCLTNTLELEKTSKREYPWERCFHMHPLLLIEQQRMHVKTLQPLLHLTPDICLLDNCVQ